LNQGKKKKEMKGKERERERERERESFCSVPCFAFVLACDYILLHFNFHCSFRFYFFIELNVID
jgi:hypothetical protein